MFARSAKNINRCAYAEMNNERPYRTNRCSILNTDTTNSIE
jgi:hypothetical protein